MSDPETARRLADRDAEDTPVTWELYPDRRRGPYWLVLYWDDFGSGRMEVAGVELRAATRPARWGGEPPASPLAEDSPAARDLLPPEPITRTLLRDLPLGEIANRHRKESRLVINVRIGGRLAARSEERNVRVRELWAGRKRRGRRGHGPEHYRTVADVYAAALAEGRAPTQAVAEHFGGERMQHVKGGWSNYPVAAKWVRNARRLGLLPPARKGART